MISAFGLTGYTGPAKPPANRLCTRALPMVPRCALAPTTAIDRGVSTRATDMASAICSRSSCASTQFGDRVRSNVTSTLPTSTRRDVVWKPASWNTLRIASFRERTCATKYLMPRLAASSARWSRSKVPSPRPCSSSRTVKATSATSSRLQYASATPTIPSPISATSAKCRSSTSTRGPIVPASSGDDGEKNLR